MDKEKVKLIIRNIELLVDSLKVELLDEDHSSNFYIEDNDYDEIYTEEF